MRRQKSFVSGQISDTFGGRFRSTPSAKLGPPIFTNLVTWWDARVASSISASGGALSTWADQSGNSRTLSAGACHYGSRDWGNGIIVPDFQQENGLVLTSYGWYDTTKTVYAVILPDDVNGRCIVGGYNEVNTMFIITGGNLCLYYVSGGGGQNLLATHTGTVTAGNKYVAMLRMESSTNLSIALNNSIQGFSYSDPGVNNENYILVGRGHWYRGYWPFDGAIAELMIYSGAHTDVESTYTINNLRDKWAI